MKLAQMFVEGGIEAVKAAADGGALTIYSVARPVDPDHPVSRSGVLARFELASPAFGVECNEDPEGTILPQLAANPVQATGSGTPGFARLFKADGTPIADLSAGPGETEIKLSEVSTTPNYPIALTRFHLHLPDGQ
jgi:hypothetical protein